MSTVIVALFPNAGPRPAKRSAAGGTRLSHAVAIGFALVPLAAMGRVFGIA